MTKYAPGDILTLESGTVWKVRSRYVSDGRPGVALVNPDNPGHGTSFYTDVLDTLVVKHVRLGLFIKHPMGGPAENGDGDVRVTIEYETDHGTCKREIMVSVEELARFLKGIS